MSGTPSKNVTETSEGHVPHFPCGYANEVMHALQTELEPRRKSTLETVVTKMAYSRHLLKTMTSRTHGTLIVTTVSTVRRRLSQFS